MSAKFNLDSTKGISDFEAFAGALARDILPTFMNPQACTPAEMWESQIFDSYHLAAPWGCDENGQPLALATDMKAARIIYERVAGAFLDNQ